MIDAAATIQRRSCPRILLATADVGCGHVRAAAALALAIRRSRPEAATGIIDVMPAVPAWFSGIYRDAYLVLARHAPRVTGWMYRSSDKPGVNADARSIASWFEARALRRFTASRELRAADAVVCTHFLCARVLSRMRARGELNARLAVVVTDQHPHAVWRVGHADLFLVASSAAADELRAHGVPAERVVVTGIPVDERFGDPLSQADALAKHNLRGDAPVILLTGGGLGLGRIDLALRGLLYAQTVAQILVVCGRNERLRESLERMLATHPLRAQVRLFGLTNRMHELMAAADLFVGKPGGLTTAEAAARGLPMLLLNPIPGQEERNAQSLVAAGAARLIHDPHRAGELAARLAEDPAALARMRLAAAEFGRGRSASLAADAVLALSERIAATSGGRAA